VNRSRRQGISASHDEGGTTCRARCEEELEFKGGHWLSVYPDRLGAGAPAIEMRMMTKDRRASVMLSEDVPSYETQSLRFMWRLFAAWAAIGFRAPRSLYVAVADGHSRLTLLAPDPCFRPPTS
jgi:hypothetical protein